MKSWEITTTGSLGIRMSAKEDPRGMDRCEETSAWMVPCGVDDLPVPGPGPYVMSSYKSWGCSSSRLFFDISMAWVLAAGLRIG